MIERLASLEKKVGKKEEIKGREKGGIEMEEGKIDREEGKRNGKAIRRKTEEGEKIEYYNKGDEN